LLTGQALRVRSCSACTSQLLVGKLRPQQSAKELESRRNVTDRESLESLGVQERDIDHCWEHYLKSSPYFRRRVLDALGELEFADPRGGRICRVAVSVADASGETDVLAEWRSKDGSRLVLLLEDKLNASFQPAQGQRYARRVASLNDPASASHGLSVLVAPRGYLNGAHQEMAYFDHMLPLEDVLEWMESAEDMACPGALARAREGLRRAAAGITLGAKGLFPDLHSALNDECHRRATGLAVRNNATDWVFFDHHARRTGLEIRYRIGAGISELAFTSAFKGDLAALQQRLPKRFRWSRSGTMSFIRKPEPRVSSGALNGAATKADVDIIVSSLHELVLWWESDGLTLAYSD